MTPPSQVYQEFDYIVQKYLGMQVWKVAFVEPQIIFLDSFHWDFFSQVSEKELFFKFPFCSKNKNKQTKNNFYFQNDVIAPNYLPLSN